MGKLPTKRDIISKYLDGDLQRFLKRVYRYSKNELIFSVTLKKYDEKCPGIKKEILRKFKREFPGLICDAIHVHEVMVKYYSFIIDMEDIYLSWHISNVLADDIKKHRENKLREKYTSGKYIRFFKPVTPAQAKRELRARGFVKINDFEDYDPKWAHITTNINIGFKPGKRLYYPRNFAWDDYTKTKARKNQDFVDIYLASGQGVGISNFTRILTPRDR